MIWVLIIAMLVLAPVCLYSYIRMDFVNTIISTATYLILMYAVANIEKD